MGDIIRKELYLKDLSCANCAAKIEQEVRALKEVHSASVDFVLQKLVFEIDDKINLQEMIKQISKIAIQIESGITVVDDQGQKDGYQKYDKIRKDKRLYIGIGTLLFFVAVFTSLSPGVEFGIFLISYLLIGGEVLLKAVRNIIKGRVFDESFLMSVATIGAFSIKQFSEGVAVMLFYEIGMFFQESAINRSRKSIRALLDIRPDYANLKVGADYKRVSPETVQIRDMIRIKPGERVPLDGKIVEGNSMLDTSALTGESMPREVEAGDEVLSGSININGLLTVEVTKEFGESTVVKILDLVQNASSKKAPTENFITTFARSYTPVVVGAALVLAVIPPLLIPGATSAEWINRALVFLVVSCPCALIISIPLGFFGGIGGASKNGILIKGSNYLEALHRVDTVVFDKTGTLTKGVFIVTKVHPIDDTMGCDLLEYAAYAESCSNHPIALSIVKAYGKDIDSGMIKVYEEVPGYGTRASVRDKEILLGNKKWMSKKNMDFDEVDEIGTLVYVAMDGKYVGYIVIEDEIKEDALETIRGLRDIGVKKLVMFTGDRKSTGEKLGHQLELDEVFSELLPHQKVEKLEELEQQTKTGGKLLFMGDGINDAPVLARADIGVAMGGLGSDAAIEAADVILMTDEPSKLLCAIKIAKNTRNIVWQNIVLALSIKAIVLVLGAVGLATMWEAVFADVGVTILAVLNATRVMKIDRSV